MTADYSSDNALLGNDLQVPENALNRKEYPVRKNGNIVYLYE